MKKILYLISIGVFIIALFTNVIVEGNPVTIQTEGNVAFACFGVDCETMTCDSGGEGSISCSVTIPFIGGGCSVTCQTGYYACCDQGEVTCLCCQ